MKQTPIQKAISEILIKKSEMHNLYLSDTDETGKDQIAQTNMGLSMAVETEAKFRYQHFENSATRNHFELGFIDGANWREHHPATDWDALRDKWGKAYGEIADTESIFNFFKNEINGK
mgnify:CR=1 FL=1